MTTVRESLELFLGHLAVDPRSSPNTLAAYRNDLSQFLSFLSGQGSPGSPDLAEMGVDSIGPPSLAAFVLYLRERGYSQATIARRVAALRSFFAHVTTAGLREGNPAASLKGPAVSRPTPRGINASDVRTLLDRGCSGETPEALRDRAMFTLLYQSGMRVSEMVGLDLPDLDLRMRTVRCRGRQGRERSIPLAQGAVEPLNTYLTQGRPSLERIGAEQALFLNQRGHRLTRQGFWLILKGRARQSGLQAALSPHTLRHSFALEQVDSGAALRDLKELLGHANLSSTQVYASSRRQPIRP